LDTQGLGILAASTRAKGRNCVGMFIHTDTSGSVTKQQKHNLAIKRQHSLSKVPVIR